MHRNAQRLAVVVAERCGWLLDVEERHVRRFLMATAGRAESQRGRNDRWSVEVSPQFERSLEALSLTTDDASLVRALVERIPSDPAISEPNDAGVRSIDVRRLGMANDASLPLRILYVLLRQVRQVFVLGVLPTSQWGLPIEPSPARRNSKPRVG